jgi:pimeloyl-ACP methyl ester carboxylesterase
MPVVTRRSLIHGAGMGTLAQLRSGQSMTPIITVTPAIALQDEPLHVQVVGLSPLERIALTTKMTTRDGTLWSSRATFVADADGAVDAATSPAIDGSYSGVAAMGLIWSMERDADQPLDRQRLAICEPVSISFMATRPVGTTLQTTALRRLATNDVTFRPLDDNSHHLRGGWWLPAGGGPHPTIIVLGGSGGGADHWRAALYASHGFAALALAYFGAPGLPRGLVNIPLEYVGEAIAYAIAEIHPPREFLAVEGISRGGELALLAGATYPQVRAVVGVMASGLVMGAFGDPEPGDLHPNSAWTLNGKPVPDLFEGNPRVDWSQAIPAVSLVPGYLAAMRDPASVDRATIHVERIRGPVLLVSGKDDRLAPRFALAELARQRLASSHHPWPFAHLSYEDTGHTITPPYVPATEGSLVHPVTKEVLALGGTTVGRAHANEDWWPRALAFLNDAAAG